MFNHYLGKYLSVDTAKNPRKLELRLFFPVGVIANNSLALEGGTDTLSRNVGKQLPFDAA
jgi:hypothetical protein